MPPSGEHMDFTRICDLQFSSEKLQGDGRNHCGAAGNVLFGNIRIKSVSSVAGLSPLIPKDKVS